MIGKFIEVCLLPYTSISILKDFLDTRLEKPARGAVYAAVERYLDKNTIVICDAPNYIKGFRYQLYCTAREVGALNMTVGGI